ncbi:MAG TPA: hypothetical protein VIH61_00945 [Waddliaceae bacterium]
MPPKKKVAHSKETPNEGIKIRLPGFEFTSIGQPTCRTIILLAITLSFLLAVYIIFFFQLKKENPLSWGYKQFFEHTKIRTPAKPGSE